MMALQSQINQMSLEDVNKFTAENVSQFCTEGKAEPLMKTHAAALKQDLAKVSKDKIRGKVNQIINNFNSGKGEGFINSCSLAAHLGVYWKRSEYNYPEDRKKLKQLNLQSIIQTNNILQANQNLCPLVPSCGRYHSFRQQFTVQRLERCAESRRRKRRRSGGEWSFPYWRRNA
jgi:hypothetical protein